MLTALTFEPVAGGTVTFNIGSVPAAGGISVEKFDATYDMDGQENPKHQQSGQFPNYMYVRALTVQQSGKIVGSTAANYATNRATLASILPDAGTQADRSHGVLNVTFTGQSAVHADVVITAFSIAMNLDGPISSTYDVTWRADEGYWLTGADAVLKI